MRNTILNYKFSNNTEEGDNTKDCNEIYMFIDSSNVAPELLEFAQENEIQEPYICMNLIDGTYCLVDEVGFNCDRSYSTGNMREIDLDNLDEIDQLLTSYVNECLKEQMEGGW